LPEQKQLNSQAQQIVKNMEQNMYLMLDM